MKKKTHVPIIPQHNLNKMIDKGMNASILFFPEPEDGEIFVPFSEQYYPDIMQGRYMVSNKGYIWDTYLQKKVPVRSNNPDKTKGYLKSHLASYKNDLRLGNPDFYIHRVVLSSFDYHRGCEGLQVNHKDGNKYNNALENLEWVTGSENISHAHENKFVEKSVLKNRENEKYISREDAIKVCDLRMNYTTLINISKETGIDLKVVHKILHGDLYPEISSNYTFPTIRNDKSLTDEKVIEIKQFIKNNPSMFQKDIAKKFGISTSTVGSIKTGASYAYIKLEDE